MKIWNLCSFVLLIRILLTIFIIVRLWFEVVIGLIILWLDLPNLQSIILGNQVFRASTLTIIESIQQGKGNSWSRSSIIRIHSTRLVYTTRKWWRFLFLNNAKYEYDDSKWLNVDLPNLTSISSSYSSFREYHSVTLESRLC